RELATALLRFGAAGPAPVPEGAMAVVAAAQGGVMRRVDRLLRPDELSYHAGAFIMGSSAFLLASVICLWHIPLRGGCHKIRDRCFFRARLSPPMRLSWRAGGSPPPTTRSGV